MICPHCGYDNLPGTEECSKCLQDLTQLDLPSPHNRIERSLMEDPVSVVRPSPPITISDSATVSHAVDTMLANNIGAVLVQDAHNKLVGIFTERDLLFKIVGVHDDFTSLPVRNFMTPNPVTVSEDHNLAFALHQMDIGGYRHMPVLKDGIPVGIFSVRDMLAHVSSLCQER